MGHEPHLEALGVHGAGAKRKLLLWGCEAGLRQECGVFLHVAGGWHFCRGWARDSRAGSCVRAPRPWRRGLWPWSPQSQPLKDLGKRDPTWQAL